MLKKSVQILILICLSLFPVLAQTAESQKVTNQNLSYGIVVDNSGSFRSILPSLTELVSRIVEGNKEDDETFLVRFVDVGKISLLHGFTNDSESIVESANEMYIEGGLTAILNALEFSGKHLIERAKVDNQRALVLITDGEDRASTVKIEKVVELLQKERIKVFILGVSEKKITKKGLSLLNKLASETNGKVFLISPDEDKKIVAQTINELVGSLRQ